MRWPSSPSWWFAAGGALYIAATLRLPERQIPLDPGVRSLPLVTGLLLLAFSLLEIWKPRGSPPPTEREASGSLVIGWISVAAMAAYLLLIPRAGFPLATALFCAGLGGYLRRPDSVRCWSEVLVFSTVSGLAIDYIFAGLFSVSLPPGWVGGWLPWRS